jgi:agarase
MNTNNSKESNNKKSSGFFKVEQVNGRWCFIDPDGKTFFSTGVCAVRTSGFYAPDLGYSPYYKNIMGKYKNEVNWAQTTYDRLKNWNFNTIGYGDEYIVATGMPYCKKLSMSGHIWNSGKIPDYFSEEWIQNVDDNAREHVAPLAEEKQLIGYFLDNEIHWSLDWRSHHDLFEDYCGMPSVSPGKKTLVRFLKDRYYDDITAFNTVWKTNHACFDELLNVTSLGLFPKNNHVRSDRAAFTFLVAEQYFKICYQTIKKYDSNHLILGVRYQSYLVPIEVIKASIPYVDVISVNHYFARPILLGPTIAIEKLLGFVCTMNILEEYHLISGKPVLISEFNIRAKDAGLPNKKPSQIFSPVVKTQEKRSDTFEKMMRWFISKPYAIGYHWFAYMDEPKTGRSNDGENSNTGIVNLLDEPYEVLVERMTKINRLTQESVTTNLIMEKKSFWKKLKGKRNNN